MFSSGTKLALLLGFLICGCELQFVDATPPALERRTVELELPAASEPVVLLIVWNVQLPDASGCAALHAQVLAWRQSFLAAFPDAEALADLDLSRGCRQQAHPTVDAAAVEAALAGVVARHPGANVRPIWLYLDNLERVLPVEVSAALLSLGDASLRAGALEPIRTAVTTASVSNSFHFDHAASWTHSGDPRLLDGPQVLATQLPLITQNPVTQVPALSADEAAGVQAFKVCAAAPLLSARFPLTADQAIPVAPGEPIAVDVAFPPLLAQERQRAIASPRTLVLELCRAHCDRFLFGADGGQTRWDLTPGCFTPEAPR